MDDIKALCKQIVVFDQKLPTTKCLSFGIWIVVTNKPLTFTINYQSYEFMANDINNASIWYYQTKQHLQSFKQIFTVACVFWQAQSLRKVRSLPSTVEVTHNISHFSIWNDSRTDFVKLKSLGLPSHLLDLKEIPMRNFLRDTGIYKSVDFDSAESSTNWTLVIVITVTLVLCTVIIVWFILHKFKCNRLNLIIGKHLTNDHDFERVNDKTLRCPPF